MEPRNREFPLENLAAELRRIYRSDPRNSEQLIANFLKQKLQTYPPSEQMNVLKKIVALFNKVEEESNWPAPSKELPLLLAALFGKHFSAQDLSSPDSLEKLTNSLNTVFDTLNQIIGVIHSTLLGEKSELETIRLVIGSNLRGETFGGESLQNYLSQIRDAFLISHKAFRLAAQTKIGELLKELDPDRIAAEGGGGFEFGPLRKAKLFDIYKEKFMRAKGYFESGRLLEELLREFEKDCQKLFASGKRGEHEKIH